MPRQTIGYNTAMAEILIVDDERMIRAGLAQLLAGAGFAVREARNGKSALTAVVERRPDLVLLDVMMPGMDGFEVCEKLLAADRDLPVVFLTAKDSESDQVRGLEAGADDFLSKTVGEEVLLARVRKALARTARLAASAAPSEMTRTEADIYRLLSSARGKWFSYREIFDSIRGEGYYGDEGAIRSHVSRLREKLPPGERIESKRGRGYALIG